VAGWRACHLYSNSGRQGRQQGALGERQARLGQRSQGEHEAHRDQYCGTRYLNEIHG